jgi:hypothetical protein
MWHDMDESEQNAVNISSNENLQNYMITNTS